MQFVVTPLVEKLGATQRKFIENSEGYVSMERSLKVHLVVICIF
jgi:hypothetical protein